MTISSRLPATSPAALRAGPSLGNGGTNVTRPIAPSVDRLSARLGLTTDAMRSLLASGGVSIGATGLPASLPMTSDGVPDIEALREAGASIKGAVPPGGEPVMAVHSQFGMKACWAFEVDLHDGRGPQFVKGGAAGFAPESGQPTRGRVLADLLDTVDRLPDSLVDYLHQQENPTGTLFDERLPERSIDLFA